ncbi:F-box only protein 21-like [Trichogramma pretiosum]|uniref:F-box only protein 21-like n=1 Tax=Trichogramma pretiosum TaxID=7493 RepID=UPI0006C9DE9B|nr:F-box only protein 21-like [Trichogramma pretiosum]
MAGGNGLHIASLPFELIEMIAADPQLSLDDVKALMLTCRRLNGTVRNSNHVWKYQFFRTWPNMAYIYQKQERQVKDWYLEMQASMQLRKEIIQQLALISPKYYYRDDISYSAFANFDRLCDEGTHVMAYYFIIDELIRFINLVDERRTTQLTLAYYAKKVIRHLVQKSIEVEWEKFMKLPPSKQLLEIAATLVAQWTQPTQIITYEYISSMLDDIADRAMETLKIRHPKHPIFSTSQEVLDHWKNHNIDDNQWSLSENQQILAVLSEVMFVRLHFRGDRESYYLVKTSLINKVLEFKYGVPLTLAIIYESVGRRLGIKCEPVNFPTHFLLRWKETYKRVPNPSKIENYYVDVFSGGHFLTYRNCPRIAPIAGVVRCPHEEVMQNVASAKQVIERMASNIETAARSRSYRCGSSTKLRSAFELLHMLKPKDTGVILHIARYYMLYKMDLSKFIKILTDIKQNSELVSRGPATNILKLLQDYEIRIKNEGEYKMIIKKRRDGMRHTIGAIMEHTPNHELCVIIGWEWRRDIHSHEFKEVLFYQILTDEMMKWTLEECLSPVENPRWIENYDIGRYFNEFKGTHYVPVEEFSIEYPEDAAVRDQYIARTYRAS